MKATDLYHRFVFWSEEDGCYIGTCPDLCGPCCHGHEEAEVYRRLCRIVEEHVALCLADGRTLPPVRTRPVQEAVSI